VAYDGKIMRAALQRFDEDRQRRADQFNARRRRVFREIPEMEDIERELQGTVSRIISSALRRGTDPVPAIRVLRDRNLELQQRREELMRAHGFPADYLEEKPRCAFCGDSGYRGGEVCSCLQNYYAREQIAELSRMLDIGTQSFDTFRLDWYSDERQGRRYSPRETARHNFDVCRAYAEDFGRRGGNLLLFGAPGLGKTFLSACIARVVSEDGFSVVYDTAGHIFTRCEQAKFRREDEEAEEDVRRYKKCDLLILDDLGTEMLTGFVQSALYELVNDRLLNGKSTIINTNLDPEEIGRRYSPQVLSRIEGEYEILPFIGEDIRRIRREQL
jgi:DNA replication protein DnaC